MVYFTFLTMNKAYFLVEILLVAPGNKLPLRGLATVAVKIGGKAVAPHHIEKKISELMSDTLKGAGYEPLVISPYLPVATPNREKTLRLASYVNPYFDVDLTTVS